MGADRLEQRLEVGNTGDAPLSFTTALHTYYTVSSIHNVLAQSGSRIAQLALVAEHK